MSEALGDQIILPFGATFEHQMVDFVSPSNKETIEYSIRAGITQVVTSHNGLPVTDLSVYLRTHNKSTDFKTQDTIHQEWLTAERTVTGYDFSKRYGGEEPANLFQHLALQKHDELKPWADDIQTDIRKHERKLEIASLALTGSLALFLANRFGYDLLSDTPYNDTDRVFDGIGVFSVVPFLYLAGAWDSKKQNEMYLDRARINDRLKRINGFLESVKKNGLHPKPTEIK